MPKFTTIVICLDCDFVADNMAAVGKHMATTGHEYYEADTTTTEEPEVT